jgi:hypothetical protein
MQHLLFVTDFSGQVFNPVFKDQIFKGKDQDVKNYFRVWPWNKGLIYCPATSLTNYQSALYNIAEKRRPYPILEIFQ